MSDADLVGDADPGPSAQTSDDGTSRRTSRSPRLPTEEAIEAHKDVLLTRLRRIEGQVRGVQRMVDADTYCIDVLTQVTAIKRALEKVSLLLVEDHLKGCVLSAVQEGDTERAAAHLAEATTAMERLLKS